ncbi:MAG TPA: cyclic nucleotide-binding domain-containing protein [Gaiellaceae bacterium]|nr:cyclic nucleotide-binding domain-containing protein [Gaiellaceae bacterium]
MPARPGASSAVAVLRDALGNRSIRRIEIAWTTGTAADWAFLVILLVVAYDAGGALAVGALGAIRVVPAIVAAPFATMLVERFSGDRVLTAINVARSVGALLTAVVIALDLPLAVTFALAAAVAGAGALVRPIQSALLPAFARTPGELVAANVTSSLGEGLGTFAGPLVASAVVATTDSAAASLLVAAAFAGAAAAVTGVHFERPADARAGRSGDDTAPSRIADTAQVIRRYPATTILLADFFVQVFVRGLLITLIVVASIELLEMGDAGVGLLNAAIGLGGLVGAAGALGLTGGRRLSGVFVLALAAWGLPLAVIGAWPVAALALAALFVTGISNAVLDVAGFTLMQRGTRNEDRVTVFGFLEVLVGVALLAGSLVAPVLVAVFGARGAFVVAGAILPALALATWRPIARETGERPLLEERIALLRRDPLFAPLPLTALDLLAERMTPISYAAGETLMRKGERGQEYVLLASGEVDVTDDGRALGAVGPGEGVGEIALLYDVPRTATVVARSAVDGFRIDSSTFLDALTGPAAGAIAERIAAHRLERSARGS